MTRTPVNKQFIYPGNDCFGCGPDNVEGLRIEIHRDGDRTDRLVGVYRPRATGAGFPGIAHGGAQFTALDCMAGWAMFLLRNDVVKGMPLTTTASVRYRKPARVGEELALSSEIVREAEGKSPFAIHTEIRDSQGELLSEVDFEYILVETERFRRTAGIPQLPEHYLRHFGLVA